MIGAALCLLLTAFIFLSYYQYLHSLDKHTSGFDKILFPFLLTCAQIVLTELLLGICGHLNNSLLAFINIAISSGVILRVHRGGIPFSHACAGFCRDVVAYVKGVNQFFDFSLICLAVCALIAYSWILIADYLLPLRGVDDLYYHLPPVFNYIKTQSVHLLPLELRHQFAYPQNAEFLIMWPLIFFRELRMLDAVNVPFIMISVITLLALLEMTSLPKREKLFLALLYALCPTVLMQAGSNYIDVIVALFLLLSLYYTIRFLELPDKVNLMGAAVAIGLVSGMKYTALFMVIPLQVVIIGKLCTRDRRQLLLYGSVVFGLCGWWYVRNMMVLGNPLFPLNVAVSGMGFMAGEGHGVLADVLTNLNDWLLLFPIQDIGLGSYDGGFGLVFWGLGVPSWLLMTAHYIMRPDRAGITGLLLHIQLPINFFMLLLIPKKEMIYAGRMSLVVVAVGLYSLGCVLVLINDRLYVSLIKSVCVVFSAFTVCLLASSTMPSFRFDRVISDRMAGQRPSEFRYADTTNDIYAALSQVWEPLDLLTRDDKHGTTCYFASDKSLALLAPLYGSRLQNRISNIDRSSTGHVDALVYCSFPDRYDFGRLIKNKINYIGQIIALDDVVSRPEYQVVTASNLGVLLFRRAFLMDNHKRNLLCSYYGERWPQEVTIARELLAKLDAGVPVITSHPLAYGMKNVLGSRGMENVFISPTGKEHQIAHANRIRRFISIGNPVEGFDSVVVTSLKYIGSQLDVYQNSYHDGQI